MDDKKVSDHHAIIPTEQGIRLNELEYGERKIYELVVSRFLAVLLPPCEYQHSEVTVLCQGERLVIKGKVMEQPGWQEIRQIQEDAGILPEDGMDEDAQNAPTAGEVQGNLPDFAKGQKILFTDGKITEIGRAHV